MEPDNDDYFIALQDQRVFGAGIKRKRVPFVPAGSELKNDSVSEPLRGDAVASYYESLVLDGAIPVDKARSPETSNIMTEEDTPTESFEGEPICEICQLPLSSPSPSPADAASSTIRTTRTRTAPHESSLAHQVCLAHSHPPSHLDPRNRGFRYLALYGWNPNRRQGLGPSGDGRLYPVKTQVKNDTVGIGVKRPEAGELAEMKAREKEEREKRKKLDAKGVRRRDDEERRRAEKLQRLFYQPDDVIRYLGTDL